ncbi:hypothetical protein HBI37_198680 [Parastagonospora nodorum]|nr:hypothetical protein HBH96_179010 [Parastagonospora nodorum]KAH5172492.1 hypothetical protein HBH77_217370 [Parastagonospora nodorum]KAH5301366.1 hypothetical protein HBI12_189320 [Parastagonospora nodorum]KAH6110295.1 hypothetical protein HBI64_218470 [Parastagonospora nodorum]KAH6328337.1 hypothetical protein HBI37_198680 [Parastagonospora nodorum]
MASPVSVGDVIAVGKLIKDIVGALQPVGGAKSDYQELVREFQSLDTALRHLDRLEDQTTVPNHVGAIKAAALICRHPLQDFLTRIKKYETSLGPWSRAHAGKAAKDKLRWALGEKDDIRRLQTYLAIHLGTINTLLLEHGLEQMNLSEKKAEEDVLQTHRKLDAAHTALQNIQKDATGQAAILRTMQTTLGTLCNVVCGEVRTSLQNFTQVVNTVCASTQQIYTVVLEFRDSMNTVDTRFTYFQAPFQVEDALGFMHLVPSEYLLDEVENVLRYKFRKGPGATAVLRGDFELFKTKKRTETITAATQLLPGMAITMAVIIASDPVTPGTACPIRRCGSIDIASYPGGGFKCRDCEVWFDQVCETKTKDTLLSKKRCSKCHELLTESSNKMSICLMCRLFHRSLEFGEKLTTDALHHATDHDEDGFDDFSIGLRNVRLEYVPVLPGHFPIPEQGLINMRETIDQGKSSSEDLRLEHILQAALSLVSSLETAWLRRDTDGRPPMHSEISYSDLAASPRYADPRFSVDYGYGHLDEDSAYGGKHNHHLTYAERVWEVPSFREREPTRYCP